MNENDAENLWFETWKFCGCGDPGLVWKKLAEMINALTIKSEKDEGAWNRGYEKANEVCKESKVLYWLLLYILDTAKLLEHNGTVSSGKLTEKGLALHKFMNENPTWEP